MLKAAAKLFWKGLVSHVAFCCWLFGGLVHELFFGMRRLLLKDVFQKLQVLSKAKQ